ncbi:MULTISPECIES: SDR family NAD(P)-dependent oxidoreductase [Mycobacterium]|uniref:3-oxoacyl-[acyl-carrier-protein] reductase MabA n=1 Tax=Mycobacterium kiyosense TaxID=2871094 RepID=A0A9P3QBX5_9MYCO|nr:MULTISPECIES: SDR family oxidoreductase [Mycobacterium]BDE12515.1 short-chain dehydrogenase/reductase [Mycobacterium sp. 20KCMC460]GLB84316.1 short-chain dehydrogenase/reductase [Mycobacterium kiyosense]GLB91003.1 short-chain dehydrogenase/reductase [Mycobacterium kiyosense]GLB96997.1 short-chain dehydrogenase/reductase [Mycobacterium kiyosense]GLC04163.1 short-chain dehydrogenase/reductase [Mycobacterium kiyosense]
MSAGFELFDLTGRTALVTGGSTGLGYHMARGLLKSGATVVIAARRESLLKEAADKLAEEAPQGNVDIATIDLQDRSSISDLAAATIDKFGGVDIFVGNAGADLFEPVDAITDERMDQIFQINVMANVALTRAFLPRMRQQKWGRLIYSSSTTSVRGSAQEGMSLYTAAKSAMNAFARTAAAETGHDNITVNTIVLGMYWTDMLREHLKLVEGAAGREAVQGFELSFAGMTAAGRLGDCIEIEGAVQLLASDAGSYITGTNFAVDGGMSSMLRPNAPKAERLLYS